ncbi:MAG: glycosyltransferase [Eggerthellaceae bacterium]|nr:glycosyltransferase [Eggerthellaceae bacterium]
MNIDITGVCRGGAKVFFKLLVSDIDSANLVSVHAKVHDNPIPCMVFESDSCSPVLEASCARDFTVIIPQVRVDVTVYVNVLSAHFEKLGQAEYVIRPNEAKWRSRINRVMHPGILSSIRNCDYGKTLGRTVIKIHDCVPVRDSSAENLPVAECIYHGTAFVPCTLSPGSFTLRCFDGECNETGVAFTYAPAKMVAESKDMTTPLWEVDFSMRASISLDGFTIVAYGADGKAIVGFESLADDQIVDLKERVAYYFENAWSDADYHNWFIDRRPKQSELAIQRHHPFNANPTFSIIIPIRRTSARQLRETVDSILAQTYPHFEIILVNGDSAKSKMLLTLADYSALDARIAIVEGKEGEALGVSEAFIAATGDFVAFVEQGDVLEPDILFEYTGAINDHPETDVIYCDEDCLMPDGTYSMPVLKPDYSVEYLRSTDYIRHLIAVRASIARSVPAATGYSATQREYDFVLRVTEAAGYVAHVSKVLYHHRAAEKKVSPKAAEASCEGTEVVRDQLRRLGIEAKVSCHHGRFNRVDYLVCGTPTVSIIIPSKDARELLARCVSSIVEKTTYENYEIIIVENNSSAPETFDYYRDVQTDDGKIRVVTWTGEGFNYSSLINFGATHANGEYFLLLNNDMEVITPEWIELLLGCCQRKDVGAVGAKLLYPDQTIQHAGVVVTSGSLEHIGYRVPLEYLGYMSVLCQMQDVSAVTGACMMVSREAFESLNGFDEAFAVTYNDVDFCLRLRETGKLIVYNPFVELYHYESVSRGHDDAGEKRQRVMKEWSYFWYRWPDYYVKGDPFFNKNFDQDYTRVSYHRLNRRSH